MCGSTRAIGLGSYFQPKFSCLMFLCYVRSHTDAAKSILIRRKASIRFFWLVKSFETSACPMTLTHITSDGKIPRSVCWDQYESDKWCFWLNIFTLRTCKFLTRCKWTGVCCGKVRIILQTNVLSLLPASSCTQLPRLCQILSL